MIYKKITDLIGNTPLLEIDKSVHGLENVNLYAKLELFNPFGSVKDRIALGMIKDNIDEIKQKNMTIIEASSGNTAKALQVLASVNGVKFKSVTNRMRIEETKNILKLIGGEIEELPGISLCPDPNDQSSPINHIKRIVKTSPDKYFNTSQYSNEKNYLSHYFTTGKEIYNDLKKVDYFFSTLGTSGSSKGTYMYLKEKNPDIKMLGIIASKDDYIPGIRNIDEMREVGIFDKSLYTDIITVNSKDAIDSMLTLIRKTGILGGPTSGACYHGMIDYLKKIDSTLNKKINVVFIVCDRVEWYVSYIKKRRSDLFNLKTKSIIEVTSKELKTANSISVEKILNWISINNPLIIDLRGNISYQFGHINNSINILDEQFEEMILKGKPFPKGKKILLVCSIGEKSKKYCVYLCKKGYDCYTLEGGMIEWKEKGLEMENYENR